MKLLEKRIIEHKEPEKYVISTIEVYIDNFGKQFETIKQWDSFRSKEQWEREKETQIMQMKNCGRI